MNSTQQQGRDILLAVCAAMDRLSAIAETYDGFIPSILDPQSGSMFKEPPPATPGQREGDRARWGANLMHDHPLLLAMMSVGVAEGIPRYRDVVDRYLTRFVSCCADEHSGLFVWGEHAYWRLDTNQPGNSIAEGNRDPAYPIIHDHLRAVPLWLWQQIDQRDHTRVQRYAHGLDFHFKQGQPTEYSRHACLRAGDPALADHKGYEASGRPRRLLGEHDGANDFPRHSGFYAFDTAFAWSQSEDPQLRSILERAADYWWRKKDDQGALKTQSRGPGGERAVAQTLSLAASLLETASVLRDGGKASAPALSAEYERRAHHYIDLALMEQEGPEAAFLSRLDAQVWGGGYGEASLVLCRYPVWLLGLYRQTGRADLLDLAQCLARRVYAKPLPREVVQPVVAMDLAMAMAAAADLYEITREAAWLEHGVNLAGYALRECFTSALPTAAAGVTWYDAQLGSGYLIHALSRLGYLASSSSDCPVPPDYTNR